ncbi:pyridoxal phosphate-dependent aminotransferase family protein [Lacibacter luteus]|uniref:Pyridoxal phosphate-dependent aminotransferase family protein n=1 Tax=Lacibacter luteus TaxID=2508719 RepID=A0A4Q1CLJ2_9BACT|nr:aminotransferase class I/II-fold pyridoxal phosphate-dependent enzyme [Lacibacter luteus]RXK61873.1 pyridoxal phosphate-dependent aminotransferase family protein [Lacibacter luteus]
MITLQNIPGRTTIINNEEFQFFSGYSYLGLGMLPAFTDLVKKGIDLYGVVYPSSRISNTQLALYAAMEKQLAAFTQTEDAACLSSGFLSARTAVEVVSEEMMVYALQHTHPSSTALAGIQQIPAAQSWEEFLRLRAAANEFRFAVAADSIHATPGHINDFSFFKNTPANFSITLIIDDSHGIGWLGKEGRGIVSLLQLPDNIELLLNFSLSKAFHMNGGAVCGSRKWINAVRKHVNYATSTPFMPSLAYAFTQAGDLFQQQRVKLQQNIEYLQKLTASHTFVANEGTPVFVVAKKGIAQHLLQNNMIISSFGYPHPEDDPVNRVVVNALHTNSDLEKLVRLLEAF